MEHNLTATLIAVAAKLNNLPDEGTLQRNLCILAPEIEQLAHLWHLSPEETLLLSAVIIQNTSRIFEQCTFTDLARACCVPPLELTAYYRVLENLVDKGFLIAADVQIDEGLSRRAGFQRLALRPDLPQLGYRYFMGEKVAAQLFGTP